MSWRRGATPPREQQPEPEIRVEPQISVEQLLQELGPPFGIAVRRAPAVGASRGSYSRRVGYSDLPAAYSGC